MNEDNLEVTNGASILKSLNGIQVDKYITADQGGIEKVLGKPIVITKFAERNSSYQRTDGTRGVFFAISANLPANKKGEVKSIGFNTGSGVLQDQLRKLEAYFPVEVVIEKVTKKDGQRYYQIRN